MNIDFSEHALKDYARLSKALQRTADKQFSFLLSDLRHPSLQTKKYDEEKDIWQGRITKDFRFYFCIEGHVYRIIRVIKHPK